MHVNLVQQDTTAMVAITSAQTMLFEYLFTFSPFALAFAFYSCRGATSQLEPPAYALHSFKAARE
jgi:hypothetical protein